MVMGTLLCIGQVVNSTLCVTLSAIGSQQAVELEEALGWMINLAEGWHHPSLLKRDMTQIM